MGSISSYNIAGLISQDSEEVSTQIAKNCRRRQLHSHLTSTPRGTPRRAESTGILPIIGDNWREGEEKKEKIRRAKERGEMEGVQRGEEDLEIRRLWISNLTVH